MDSPFGTALKGRRESLRLKQHHVAAQIGVDVSTISMWETGEMRPHLTRAAKVAAFMDMPVHELMDLLIESAEHRRRAKKAEKDQRRSGRGRGKKRAA
jgi:transcriptional regulator with XRE-family HTH domain